MYFLICRNLKLLSYYKNSLIIHFRLCRNTLYTTYPQPGSVSSVSALTNAVSEFFIFM